MYIYIYIYICYNLYCIVRGLSQLFITCTSLRLLEGSICNRYLYYILYSIYICVISINNHIHTTYHTLHAHTHTSLSYRYHALGRVHGRLTPTTDGLHPVSGQLPRQPRSVRYLHAEVSKGRSGYRHYMRTHGRQDSTRTGHRYRFYI